MIALTIPGRACLIVGPAPTLCQLVGSGIHIESHELMTGVDTTTQENTRFAAIQIRGAEEMLGRAVTITVTPGFIQICLAFLKTLQRVIHRHVRHTRSAVNIDQIFCALVHKPVGTATGSSTIVDRGIADNVCLTVGSMNRGAIGSTHDCFCLAVHIPVVGHDILFIVLEVAHIRTTVDPPKHSAIEFQAFKDGIFAIMTITWETGTDFTLVVIF